MARIRLAARAFTWLMIGGLVATTVTALVTYQWIGELLEQRNRDELHRLANLRLERERPVFNQVERILVHLREAFESEAAHPPEQIGGGTLDLTSLAGGGHLLLPRPDQPPMAVFVGGGVELGAERRAAISAAWEVVHSAWPAYRELFPTLSVVSTDRWLVACGNGIPGMVESMLGPDPVLLPGEKALLERPGRGPRWSKPYPELGSGSWQTAVLIPAVPRSGGVCGILFILPLGNLIDRCARDQPEGSQTSILTTDGELVHHPGLDQQIASVGGAMDLLALNSPLTPGGEDLARRLGRWRELENSGFDSGVLKEADGSHLAITRFTAAGLVAVTHIPASVIDAPAWGAAKKAILLGLVLTSTLAVLSYFVLHHLVSLPLRLFATAAGRLAAGERGLRLDDRRDDELGDLARSLRRMDRAVTAAEAELRRLNADLEARVARRTAELESLAKELESFSYSVSHDLRAPLRAIDGFSAILQEDYGGQLDDEGRRVLGRIREGSKRMGQLIQDVLTLSRISRAPLRWEPVDLTHLAGEIRVELEASDPGRTVVWDIAPGMATATDPGLIRLVLDNLIGNAWKYTGNQPQARITVRLAVTVTGEQELVVEDNGAGFDPALGDKLFRPFSRLHSAAEFPGTGVGLATVRRIANRMGGDVRGNGAKGQGATFAFRLPDPTKRPGSDRLTPASLPQRKD